MGRAFWCLGGDERSFYAAQYLKSRGLRVCCFGVPGMENSPLLERLERVILPFPSFQGALLRGKSAIPVEELLCRLGAGSCVYGGLLSSHAEVIRAHGGKPIDLYGAEPLTTENAALTAEGAICLAIGNSPVSLQGASCLVIGFGRIGKLLAQKLCALGARVTVATRKEADRALAEALGCLSEETGAYRHGLGQFDFLFNTVPAPVLSRAQLETFSPRCLMMELASQPGGFSPEDCKELGLSYLPAPGLPGRFSPKTAGALYAGHILDKEEGF